MSRQSLSCLPSQVSKRLIIGLLLIASALCHASPVQDGMTTGTAFLKGRFDSKEGIAANAVKPIQGTQMMKTQGGQPFSAAAVCASTSPAVPILSIAGVGLPTGDLVGVQINADMNLDNVVDANVSIPVPVSGVCTNGYVACDPGTWNNCTYNQWTATTSTISSAGVSLAELVGCYCINDSCASTATRDKPSDVLSQIGAGVLSAVQQVNASFVMTRRDVSASSVKFYGQDPNGCRPAGPNLQTFFGASDQLPNAVSNEVTTQRGMQGSMYNLVFGAAVNADSQTTVQTCSIKRSVTLNDVPLDQIIIPGTGGYSVCGADCVDLKTTVSYRRGGNCTWASDTASATLFRPDLLLSATLEFVGFDDFSQVFISDGVGGETEIFNGMNVHSGGGHGACDGARYWNFYPGTDLVPNITANPTNEIRFRQALLYGGSGAGNATIRLRFDNQCKVDPNEPINDGCQSIAQDPDCKLMEENVDGVVTYLDYAPTGNLTAPVTRTITSNACVADVTRPWWTITRKYRCKVASQYDFTDALHRTSVAQSTATSGGNFTEVHRASDGSWASQDLGLGQPAELPAFGNCEMACKLRSPVSDDRVALTGVVGPNRNMSTRYQYRYAVCDASNTCPLNPGEEMIKPCQCLNEFGEAATIMQLMRQAGQDLICSP